MSPLNNVCQNKNDGLWNLTVTTYHNKKRIIYSNHHSTQNTKEDNYTTNMLVLKSGGIT
jgi:hypothetical protein